MNFDFSEDQKLLQQTARDYLEEHAPLALCREVLETDTPYAKALWKGAAEMGWLGAAIPEEYGGAGFGHLELAVIAEEVGRALAPIPFGSSVYLASEALLCAGSDEQKQRWLPKLASGEAIGTLALVEKPGHNAVEGVEARFADGALAGSKGPVLDGDVADFAIVAAQGEGGIDLAIVELGGKGVERTPVTTFDPSRSAANITFAGAPAERLGEAGAGASLVSHILDRAAVLAAFEQLGSAERAFAITKDFIEGRYAFGRPVASFQAIKHRMADLWCEIQLARSNAYYGAWALSNGEPELDVAACISRVQATTAFDQTTMEMVEFHGGVGFTWEYDCHLFYRRAKLLGAWLGTAASWRDKLVDRVEARENAA
jgi:acyl-CoA dehydrogenase